MSDEVTTEQPQKQLICPVCKTPMAEMYSVPINVGDDRIERGMRFECGTVLLDAPGGLKVVRSQRCVELRILQLEREALALKKAWWLDENNEQAFVDSIVAAFEEGKRIAAAPPVAPIVSDPVILDSPVAPSVVDGIDARVEDPRAMEALDAIEQSVGDVAETPSPGDVPANDMSNISWDVDIAEELASVAIDDVPKEVQ